MKKLLMIVAALVLMVSNVSHRECQKMGDC
jgi:hypothetical protein